MTRILAENPKDVIFVFDNGDIYPGKTIQIYQRFEENYGYSPDSEIQISLNWQEAMDLASKLMDFAQNRKTLEEL